MRKAMKKNARKATRLLSVLMTGAIMGSLNPLYAFAQEYIVEGDSATGSIEISFADAYEMNEYFTIGDVEFCCPDNDRMEAGLETAVEGIKAGGNGGGVPLYVADEILTTDMESEVRAYAAENTASRESTLKYGTVSGYLPEAGTYALYNLELSAGDYLQARLTVPNNVNINYALVIFDAELNILKQSDYATCLNDGQALEESAGYLCTADEMVYIGVLSLMGGSTTEAFTLDFAVTTDFSEYGEPDENILEAAGLNLGRSGASVSGKLNSPVDNDWYSFSVIDSPRYNKIRLNLTSSSGTNGCKMEIYKNVGTGNLSMQLVGGGSGEGEIALPAGTYYVRVISKNTLNTFNPADISVYNLSVVPVSKVDGINITLYTGNNSNSNFDYGEGYCVIDDLPLYGVRITGHAYYYDSMGNYVEALNVKLKGTLVNTSWEKEGRPDLSTTYGTAISKDGGFFTMGIDYKRAAGKEHYHGDYYDIMNVTICPQYDPQISVEGHFCLHRVPD